MDVLMGVEPITLMHPSHGSLRLSAACSMLQPSMITIRTSWIILDYFHTHAHTHTRHTSSSIKPSLHAYFFSYPPVRIPPRQPVWLTGSYNNKT